MIGIKELLLARTAIESYIYKTPLDFSPILSSHTRKVYLKLENQQLLKNFKIRGAFNKLLSLKSQGVEEGIIVASSGNLGVSISYAAKKLGIKKIETINPFNTPQTKLEKIKRYGSKVITYGAIYDESYKMALKMSKKNKTIFLDSDSDWDIITGHGTVGVEIISQNPNIDMILVPIGGGGLITGVGLAAKSLNPNIKVIGIQTVKCPAMKKSIDDGICYREFPTDESVCDALIGGIGQIPFEMASKSIDDVLLVSEESIMKATSLLLTEEKIVAEPSSALGVAALMEQPEYFEGKKIAIIITGGNLDKKILKKILIDY